MKGCFLCLYQCVLPDRCTHAEIRSDMAFPVGGGGGGGRGYRPAWGVDEVAEIASSCRRVGLECCCCCSLPPQQPCPVGVSPFTKALSEKRVAERALWHTGQDPSIYKRHLHSLVTNLDYTHTHTHVRTFCIRARVAPRECQCCFIYYFCGCVCVIFRAKLKHKHWKPGGESRAPSAPFTAYQAFSVHFQQEKPLHSLQTRGKKRSEIELHIAWVSFK